jgi:hypothetical protein
MKMYDVVCPACGAAYRVAESDAVAGCPGEAPCSACGQILASWSDRRLRAFRLEMSPKLRYAHIPVPPASFL